MLINSKKTKIIPFNFTKSKDFIPELSFPARENLEVIYQTKLVGVILDSSISWGLIRFKKLGASDDQLLTLFQLKINCLLEFTAPAFHGVLFNSQMTWKWGSNE